MTDTEEGFVPRRSTRKKKTERGTVLNRLDEESSGSETEYPNRETDHKDDRDS